MKILCLLLLATYVAAHGYEGLIKKYGEKKIYESCFGKTLFKKKMTEYYGWIKDCEEEVGIRRDGPLDPIASSPVRVDLPDYQSNILQLLNSQTAGQIVLIPIPSAYAPNTRRGDYPRSINGGRFRRQADDMEPYFTTEKIHDLKKTVKKHINMAICVLKKAKILNYNNETQWNQIKKMYQDLEISDWELKEDLLEGYNKCYKFSSCMGPDEQSSKDFPLGLKQAITYFKCERLKKVAACIKKDLRQKPEMFELGGLEGFMENYEDDEKMFKILKMYHKFGKGHDSLL